MNKNNGWLIFIGALAAAGFIWAISATLDNILLKTQLDATKKQHKALRTNYLKLLSEYLEKQKQLPTEIKEQLINLRNTYVGINDEVAIELQTIIELIQIGKEEIAIEKLTKIVENLLAEKFIKEGEFSDKKKCPGLAILLKKALDLKWISLHEYYLSAFLKDQRNNEAYELAVRFPENWKIISFLGGIEIIYNLKGIRRQ